MFTGFSILTEMLRRESKRGIWYNVASGIYGEES
jgi:hypothetical protein